MAFSTGSKEYVAKSETGLGNMGVHTVHASATYIWQCEFNIRGQLESEQ